MGKSKLSFCQIFIPTVMMGTAISYGFSCYGVDIDEMRFAWPLIILVIIFSALIIFRDLIKENKENISLTFEQAKKPIIITISTLIMVVGSSWDFPISAILFLYVSITLLGYKGKFISLILSIAVPLIIYIGFVHAGVPLKSFWLKL